MDLFVQKFTGEQSLIEGCKKKHPKSQRELYEKFSGKMFALCLRYIKDETEAEDILVKGFMKVFNKIEQYQGEGSFEGWIRKIMVNESLQYIRQNKSMYLQVDIAHAQHTLNNIEAIESRLAAEDLLNIIQQLPIGYRTIFNLYAIEGYAHQEIAAMLNISISTSKSQLSRARALLQKILSTVPEFLLEKKIKS